MSKKIYKGYELYKMIAERKIESGTNFIDELGQKWTFDGKQMLWKEHDYNDYEFSITDFELIEDETIDIESISELYSASDTDDTINELVKAVKQLDRRIKKLENKEYCQVCGVELTEENRYMKNMCNDCKYGEE